MQISSKYQSIDILLIMIFLYRWDKQTTPVPATFTFALQGQNFITVKKKSIEWESKRSRQKKVLLFG